MEAVRWHAAGDVRLDEVELALPLGPGMVEAEVAYTGICGSDVAEFRAPFAIRPGRAHPLTGQQPPLTLGHEFSAADHRGRRGRHRAGARATASPPTPAGAAASARPASAADYNLCRLSGSIGLSSDGAFAPLVRFPAYCAVPLPDAVSDEVGALLEPLAVGLHALDRGGARRRRAPGRRRLRPDRRLHGAGRAGDRARAAGRSSATPAGGRAPRPRASPTYDARRRGPRGRQGRARPGRRGRRRDRRRLQRRRRRRWKRRWR